MHLLVILLCFLFLGAFVRFLRGCLMWVLALTIIAWVLRHDPSAAKEFWDFFDLCQRKLTELINEPY
jgi:hypothetical protein